VTRYGRTRRRETVSQHVIVAHEQNRLLKASCHNELTDTIRHAHHFKSSRAINDSVQLDVMGGELVEFFILSRTGCLNLTDIAQSKPQKRHTFTWVSNRKPFVKRRALDASPTPVD